MDRVFKRKLDLNAGQEKRLNSWIGACRVVYNIALEIQESSYKAFGVNVGMYELMRQLPSLRKEYDWINDVPSVTLQHQISRLDNAYGMFFKHRKSGASKPKFVRKKKGRSIEFTRVSVSGNLVRIQKIGFLKMFKDSPIPGVIKLATIKKEPTGMFICFKCKDVPTNINSDNQTLGLDMGISNFCVDSNSVFIKNPKIIKQYEDKLRIEQRSLSRKKKFSNNWKKQANVVARMIKKLSNTRMDFLHKLSTSLAQKNSTVFLEDLNIPVMIKNKDYTKGIIDCGWGVFKTMLQYKTTVVLVNPKYTSQTCSQCGHVDRGNRITQSDFKCLSCGFKSNADVNAAKNIKSKGVALSR